LKKTRFTERQIVNILKEGEAGLGSAPDQHFTFETTMLRAFSFKNQYITQTLFSEVFILIKVLGLALYGPVAASHRIRLSQYVSGLANMGIELQIQSLLNDVYVRSRFEGHELPLLAVLNSIKERIKILLKQQNFQAIIIHCELFTFLPSCLEQLFLHTPYIYDFDDAFFTRYRSGRFHWLKPLLGNKFDKLIARSSAVTAGNTFLVEYAKKFNQNSVLLPSVVDTNLYRSLPEIKKNNIFTIGWVGSPSTEPYLKLLIKPLKQLATENPIRLAVIGGQAPKIEGVIVEEIKWSADNEVVLINGFDVGVMPLPNDEWSKGKCAFKLIQYMACGIPVLASRVGANIAVVNQKCGFLVDDVSSWLCALRELRDKPSLRHDMGLEAKMQINKNYSLERNLPLLATVIKSIVKSS
jgi:glycosyltransferase involved in cell wall biosynthesis